MTVSYLSKIATSDNFRLFKLLLTWKGSILKSLWLELSIYLFCYIFISIINHYVLNNVYKANFHSFCQFCFETKKDIPVIFVLTFYIFLVVERWTDQFRAIPWPDNIAIYVNSFITGSSETPTLIRRNIMRYVNASQALCFMGISSRTRILFPDNNALVKHGFLTVEELSCLESFKTTANKHFVPIGWAQSLVCKAQKEKYLIDNKRVMALTTELDHFRDQLRMLFSYDWINPPLIYTQISLITVFSYFSMALFAKQYIEMSSVWFYVPIFVALEFINYIGWLKVAQCLINPFGEDDDDFEVNKIIFRNLEYSLITVDHFHNRCPELLVDAYFEHQIPRLIDSTDTFISGSLGK